MDRGARADPMQDETGQDWSVEDLIPHRGRLKLIETLLAAGEDWLEAESVVEATWPLAEQEKGIPALLLIEVIAQASSLLIGWQRRAVERQGGRGALVGVRESELRSQQIPLGACLVTRVQLLRSMGGYAVFRGSVRHADQLLAQAEIQAFRPETMASPHVAAASGGTG